MDREPLITGCSFFGNEANYADKCLANHIPFFDETIILDNSNDGTTEILKRYGVKVMPQGNMPFHAGDFRNLLIKESTTPWIWFFFADELLETTLTVDEIRFQLSNLPEHVGVIRLRRWNEMGSSEEQGYKYPDFQGNIVRPDVRYTMRFHEVPTYSALGKRYTTLDLGKAQIQIRHLFRAEDGDKRNNSKWGNDEIW